MLAGINQSAQLLAVDHRVDFEFVLHPPITPENTSRSIYRFRTVPNDGRCVNPHYSTGHSTGAHAPSLKFRFACENTPLVTSEADDVRGCQTKRLFGNGALARGHPTHTARNLRRRREVR